ncbi:hypothetical protein DPEC_G00158290 [Dallia pectoralis]|uniref:Uncharacterized protein n=1 Tax=Dallia pectoralis TaxID=75939 RepID=A0ACC2GL57_DALPE|nr:hypothetical protein DPEC_G00158290 [Dallia pectoralis]
MVAVIIGLRWVEDVAPCRVVICSDSAAVLSSVMDGRSDREDILGEMMGILLRLERQGVVVRFGWVPAHAGVEGNEVADLVAKSAVRRTEVDVRVALGRREVKALIREAGIAVWERQWGEGGKGRHFRGIHRNTGCTEEYSRVAVTGLTLQCGRWRYMHL